MPHRPDRWSELFDEHGAALILLARQWMASHSDAEDVVQEAFIRFWKSRDRVDDPAAYLFATIKHCALDAIRGRERQRRREQASARTEVEPILAGPLDEAERRLVIERALSALPSNQSEVLIMRIWGGLSFPQIAEALATSTNTVGSRYRYALAKLREQLAEEATR